MIGDLKAGAHSRIIGSVRLGKKVIIGEYVTIYGPAVIGDRCYIGDFAIIGYPGRKALKNAIAGGTDISGSGAETVLGKSVMVRPRCTVYAGVQVGDNVEFGHDVLVRENTAIGEGTVVGSKVVIDGSCQVGKKVLLHSACYICAFSRIEDEVFIGPYVLFTNDRYANRIPVAMGGPVVKRKACIGAGAVILPRVTVAEGSLVGAGAVVTRDTEPNTIYIGHPARKHKTVAEIVDQN